MNIETVRQLASEAGVEWHEEFDGECCANLEMLQRFGELVVAGAVAAEREACAKVCESQQRMAGDGTTFYTASGQCAAAIRSRGQQARGE